MPSEFAERLLLVLEDDPDIREGMASVLRMAGFRVVTAANGAEGLALLRHGIRPDLILLDIAMPVKDGVEFRKEQESHAELANIPVIAMTAHSHAESKRYQIGAKDVLRKPFSAEDMLTMVRKYCEADTSTAETQRLDRQ
ncbi:MAG TPA: response regulator [Acidiferrobacteraceae bacterium]|nr:response regulator [Acidiferrobacteraceae bacterium]